MIDQQAAEKITRRVQGLLSAGDDEAAELVSKTDEFKRMCKALGIRPSVALQRIKQSMGPKAGG